MKIQAQIDLTAAGWTPERFTETFGSDWQRLLTDQDRPSALENHTDGWQTVARISEIQGEREMRDQGYDQPGVYAIIWDPDGDVDNPILWNRTIVFGETTQPAHRRLYSHVGALRGLRTNTWDKWQGPPRERIQEHFQTTDVLASLDDLRLVFKPHCNPDWCRDREYSALMETQCTALYIAQWGYPPPANSRDLPDQTLITEARLLLDKLGYEQN